MTATSFTTRTRKDPRAAGQLNARVLNSTNSYEEIEMLDTQINAPTADIPTPETCAAPVPAGFTREFPTSPLFIGGPKTHLRFDGVQIAWHEETGFQLTVMVDDDLDAKDAVKLSEAIRVGAARMKQLEAAHAGRSIWKEDRSRMFEDLWDGPSSRLADVESILQARYSGDGGLTFWFAIEQRPSEQYTLAEIKKLHRAMGRVLDKVEAEPKPAAGEAK